MHYNPYDTPRVLIRMFETEDAIRTSLQGTVDGSDSTFDDWWGQD